MTPNKATLVVDLDGTLISSDLIWESFWDVITHSPVAALSAFREIPRGRAFFKASLSRATALGVECLPFRQPVLDLIGEYKARGDGVVLCTGADLDLARRVGAHLGVFDGVFGSDGSVNLKGAAKAAFLCEKYGEGQFDYVGDAQVDLPVWRVSRKAYVVGASTRLRSRLDRVGTEVQEIPGSSRTLASWVRAIRPHQWVKNLLVFLPAVAARDFSAATWMAALVAFASFCLLASGVYLLNDLLDLQFDRTHPRKRYRPFASGDIPLSQGTAAFLVFVTAGIATGLILRRWDFLLVEAAYFTVAVAYSISLKRKLVLDICTLAGLYTLRILAGGAATGLPISVWMLAFSVFFFFALAAVKRQAELVDGTAGGLDRASGRAYGVDDLPIIAMAAIGSGYVSVLVLALYLNSGTISDLYSEPRLLWLACPILLYWLTRVVVLAHRGEMHDDPVVFAIQDRASRLSFALIALVVAAGGLL